MITLTQAVRLLGLRDTDSVSLCSKHQSHNDVFIIVKQMRMFLDMKAVRVYKIYTDHFMYDPETSLEFIVDSKTLESIRKIMDRKFLR